MVTVVIVALPVEPPPVEPPPEELLAAPPLAALPALTLLDPLDDAAVEDELEPQAASSAAVASAATPPTTCLECLITSSPLRSEETRMMPVLSTEFRAYFVRRAWAL
jgi:hypothetical protein